MSTPDINAAIIDVLTRHQPMSRKEIHDHLPAGTYNKNWSLKECLDNISSRLNALDKKGRVSRAGESDGVILWSVPAQLDTNQTPSPFQGEGRGEGETSVPLSLEGEGRGEGEALPEPSTPSIGTLSLPGRGQGEGEALEEGEDQPDLLAAVDNAFALIRDAIAGALDKPAAVRIPNKAETLNALEVAAQVLDPVASANASILRRLRSIVTNMEEA